MKIKIREGRTEREKVRETEAERDREEKLITKIREEKGNQTLLKLNRL